MYCGVYQAVDRNEQRATELVDVLCESEEAQFTVICDALITDCLLYTSDAADE